MDFTDTEFDKLMIKRAIDLSATALTQPGHYRPFGALVVRQSDGKVVAEGVNDVGKTFDPSAHGEVVAIRKACQTLGTESLAGYTIYTSCEPCPMCTAVVHMAGLSKIVYACGLSDIQNFMDFRTMFDDLGQRVIEQRSIPAVRLQAEEGISAVMTYYMKN